MAYLKLYKVTYVYLTPRVVFYYTIIHAARLGDRWNKATAYLTVDHWELFIPARCDHVPPPHPVIRYVNSSAGSENSRQAVPH